MMSLHVAFALAFRLVVLTDLDVADIYFGTGE